MNRLTLLVCFIMVTSMSLVEPYSMGVKVKNFEAVVSRDFDQELVVLVSVSEEDPMLTANIGDAALCIMKDAVDCYCSDQPFKYTKLRLPDHCVSCLRVS